MESLAPIVLSIIAAATPLLFAAVGELVVEKSGVLNLGVEGMMLTGAVFAFIVGVETGNPALSVLAGAIMGAAMALLFALLTLGMLANQVATGLALTLFGIGLSALFGQSYVGTPLDKLPLLNIPGLSDLPILGPILFGQDALVYLSFIMTAVVWLFLYRTRAGLVLRSVGENPHAAHAIGFPVVMIRLGAVLFGGAMAGLGGAYLSLSYTPMWSEEMTAGRGWIALALVVFASWRPGRVLIGAYLFGGLTLAQLHLQGTGGISIAAQFLNMLPYIATIVVLVIISRDAAKIRLNAPASIGKVFHPDG
ncbi:MAG: ABC transporter permease [Alphaproteobacteria bacterium]